MWITAGLWMSLAAASGFLAIRLKMPAALVEIVVGMLADNLIALRTNAWTAAIAVCVVVVPKVLPGAIARTGRYVSEPALRVLFAVIFLLAALATYARSEGVLPAYFLGLACAGMMTAMPDVKRRLQTMTMALLAPFYFLKAGTYVEFGAAASN